MDNENTDVVETVVPTAPGLIPQHVGSEWEKEVQDTSYQYLGTAVQVMRTVSLLQRRGQAQADKKDTSGKQKTDHVKFPPIKTKGGFLTHREPLEGRKSTNDSRELSNVKRSISLKEFLSERTSSLSPRVPGTPDGLVTNLKLPGSKAKFQRHKKLPPLRNQESIPETRSQHSFAKLSPDAKRTLTELKEDIQKESKKLRSLRNQKQEASDPDVNPEDHGPCTNAQERWDLVRKFVCSGILTKRAKLWQVSGGDVMFAVDHPNSFSLSKCALAL